MNNNSRIEYKESFFIKIKKFFKSLFIKKEESNNKFSENIIVQEMVLDNGLKEDFLKNLKIDSNSEKLINKKKFLEEIDGNIEALNSLSVDRLKMLKDYYDEVIKENNEIIKRLINKSH